jgi:hypothetical protein
LPKAPDEALASVAAQVGYRAARLAQAGSPAHVFEATTVSFMPRQQRQSGFSGMLEGAASNGCAPTSP